MLQSESEKKGKDKEKKGKKGGWGRGGGKKEDAGESVEAWMKSYCGDCESALGRVREGRSGLI